MQESLSKKIEKEIYNPRPLSKLAQFSRTDSIGQLVQEESYRPRKLLTTQIFVLFLHATGTNSLLLCLFEESYLE